MNALSTINEQRTMTLKEITDLLEVRHNDAMITVAKMSESAEFGNATKIPYRTKMGNNYETYALDKRQSIAVSAKLNTPMLMRVIDRWQELEAKQVSILPDFTNAVLMARTWADQEEDKQTLRVKNELLEAEKIADKPKIEFAIAMRNTEATTSIGDFAKTLGMGRNEFFQILRNDGFLMKNNLPYGRYTKTGTNILSQIQNKPYVDKKGESHTTYQPRITGKGEIYFEKKYRGESLH